MLKSMISLCGVGIALLLQSFHDMSSYASAVSLLQLKPAVDIQPVSSTGGISQDGNGKIKTKQTCECCNAKCMRLISLGYCVGSFLVFLRWFLSVRWPNLVTMKLIGSGHLMF